MRKVKIPFSIDGVNRMIKELDRFRKEILDGADEIVRLLAERGVQIMQSKIAEIPGDGPRDKDITVSMDPNRPGHGIAVIARGPSVLFLEFGTGITYEPQHPETPRGLERGSWSTGPNGKGHWDDPNGWWYAHGKHTMGNPAYMFTYNTIKELEQVFEDVVREVFPT